MRTRKLGVAKLMARAGLAALAFTMMASCAGQAPAAPALAADRLYVQVVPVPPDAQGNGAANPAERIAVLDAISGARQRELPAGVVAPDWSAVFTAERRDGVTVVREVDPGSGGLLRQISMPGSYQLPGQTGALGRGLSPDGHWLALEGLPETAAGGSGQSSTGQISRFAVLDTRFAAPVRTLTLAGSLSFDGLSNDGRSLYLIEDLSKQSPDRYQVRLYDLAAGALQPDPVIDKSETEIMQGWRVSSVASTDGQWLFSLYLRGNGGPFIHALNLPGRYAMCVDLPFAGQDGAGQPLWSLVLDAGRGALYAVNGGSGEVVELDAQQPHVRRSARFTPPAARQGGPLAARLDRLSPVAVAKGSGAGSAAVLAPDGKLLYILGHNGLVALGTADLTVRRRYLADWQLGGLAISSDGGRLYAVWPDSGGILQINALSGALLSQVPAVSDAEAVLRVETSPHAP